ncbi:MAG: hypothetical protein IKA95_03500 [Clostridia bacterium]|nr:hypothetical protein [Clostridia bacterium]
MIESKNKMSADELLQFLIAAESEGRKLNFLEDIYYRQLNATDGAPIDEEEIQKLTEKADKLMDKFLSPLPEEHRRAYAEYEAASNHLNGRLMYYSFKQGVKYYKELLNLIDN